MATQNLYEGAVDAFESLITVPVTIAATATSATATNAVYAWYKILSVIADNANFQVMASTAFSASWTDTHKTILGTTWDITVAQATSDATHALVYLVTLLAPRNI